MLPDYPQYELPKKPSRTRSYGDDLGRKEKLSDSDSAHSDSKRSSVGRAHGRRVSRSVNREHDEEAGVKERSSSKKELKRGPWRPSMLTVLAGCTILFGP
eukprot:1589389-Prymnesium_polylepis.1